MKREMVAWKRMILFLPGEFALFVLLMLSSDRGKEQFICITDRDLGENKRREKKNEKKSIGGREKDRLWFSLMCLTGYKV